VYPEPEQPAQRWRLCHAFDSGDDGGGASRMRQKSRLAQGKLQETVNIWRPAAWLNTTQAFKPLPKHLSYSAVNSAAMTAGCCAGLEDFNAHAPSPRTMLAYVGARGEL
jgi:hypothetical protein